MKYFILKTIFFFFLILSGLLSYGQQSTFLHFDTLFINPNQPTTNDNISLICNINFPSGYSRLDSSIIETVDSTILIKAYYSVGFAASPSNSKDTITLGKLNSGNYKLIYNAIEPGRSLSNKDSINFIVVQVVGVSERNNPIQSVSIFPNPSKEIINLKVQLSKAVTATIRITDAQGRIAYRSQLQLFKGESTHTIATANMSSGVYSLSLWEGEKLLKEERIIVQH